MTKHPLDSGVVEFYCFTCEDDVLADVEAGDTYQVEATCPGCAQWHLIQVRWDE